MLFILILFSQIRAGWTKDINDYTTKCPSCNQKFVARFVIKPTQPFSKTVRKKNYNYDNNN